MSDLDDFKARKAELRANGLGSPAAHSQAYREISQRVHEREEAWHDAQENAGMTR